MVTIKQLKKEISSPEMINAVLDNSNNPLLDNSPRALSKGAVVDGKAVTLDIALERLNCIGEFIDGDPIVKNAFLNELLNVIGLVVFEGYAYKNRLGIFEKGEMPMGWSIADIFVNVAKPYDYLITEPNNNDAQAIYALYPPEVKTAYYHLNYRKNYRASTLDTELRAAFRTYDGVRALVEKIVQSLYNGMGWDEELAGRYVISRNIVDGNVGSVSIPPLLPNNGTSITTTIKENSLDMQEWSTANNAAGVLNFTPVEEQLLLVTNRYDSAYTVEVQSAAFNLDKVEYLARKRTIRSFSFSPDEVSRLNELFRDDPTYKAFTNDELESLKKVQAVLMDRKYTQFYRNYQSFYTEPDRLHLKYNHFLHIWKVYALSPFANIKVFVSENVLIESVSVSPTALTIQKGQSGQLTATVDTTGFANKAVVWEIVEPTVNSTVSETGVVKIGANETYNILHVKVTSASDLSKFAEAIISITD